MHFLSRSQALSIVMEEERVRVRIYAWPFFSRVWIDKLGDSSTHCCKIGVMKLHPGLLRRLNERLCERHGAMPWCPEPANTSVH